MHKWDPLSENRNLREDHASRRAPRTCDLYGPSRLVTCVVRKANHGRTLLPHRVCASRPQMAAHGAEEVEFRPCLGSGAYYSSLQRLLM